MTLRDTLARLYSQSDAERLAEHHAAAAAMIADEEKSRVLRVGQCVRAFGIADPDFGAVSSSELLEHGPLIVTFYRGLWCPYCRQDLLGLDEIMPKVRETNASVVVLAHGLEPGIRAKLRTATSLNFPIVDDEGEIAEQFGLRWSDDDAAVMEAVLGTDLVTMRGTGPWIVPMQARYVIKQDGVIVFDNVAFDYSQRTEPAAVLPALAQLAGWRTRS